MNCNCNTCEGEKFSSNCLIWEGKKYEFSSFNSLIEYLVDKAKNEEKINVDLKTLSTSSLSRDEILQLLIDRQVNQDFSKSITTPVNNNCNLDISAIDDCQTCKKNFCEKLQLIVEKISILQSKVDTLYGM